MAIPQLGSSTCGHKAPPWTPEACSAGARVRWACVCACAKVCDQQCPHCSATQLRTFLLCCCRQNSQQVFVAIVKNRQPTNSTLAQRSLHVTHTCNHYHRPLVGIHTTKAQSLQGSVLEERGTKRFKSRRMSYKQYCLDMITSTNINNALEWLDYYAFASKKVAHHKPIFGRQSHVKQDSWLAVIG